MWIEKLAHGVLEYDTGIGPRYLQPSFAQRLLLMWTFRNFSSLPQQVLLVRERQLVERLMAENRFVSPATLRGSNWPVIGKIERKPSPMAEVVPMRKPAVAVRSAAGEEHREAASA